MVFNIFFSKNNKNAIKGIIKETFQNKIDNNYDNMLNETMEYVSSQVSEKPPKGMSQNDYLILMNKKVYDMITPLLKTKMEKAQAQMGQRNVRENIVRRTENFQQDGGAGRDRSNPLLDSFLIRENEIPSVMDYPQPSMYKNNSTDSMNMKMDSVKNERETLIPKLKPIDFTIKNDDYNKVDTKQLYNELLSNYKSQVSDMTQFDEKNKNANSHIDALLEHNLENGVGRGQYQGGDQGATPINALLEKKLESFESAFNRTDVETFVGNNEYKDTDKERDAYENKNKNKSNDDRYQPKPMDYNKVHNLQENNSLNNNARLEFGDSSLNSNAHRIMLEEPNFNIVNITTYITVDSRYRDLFLYPNPTLFDVKFAPPDNSLRYQNYYDSNGILIFREQVVVYGNDSDTNVYQTYDNVYSIQCTSSTVPTNCIYYGNRVPSPEINTGVPVNVYKDSYLFLNVSELRSVYESSNTIARTSFAKLLVDTSGIVFDKNYNQNIFNFTTLKTSDYDEYFIYNPQTLGKIDKMTLKLNNKNGYQYNFGIDKLFIESFSEGNERYNGYCGNSYVSTIIKIQKQNDEYRKYCSLYNAFGDCTLLNNHPVQDGDLIYLYNVLPNQDQIAYFEDYIKISKIKQNKAQNIISIYLTYTDKDGNEVPVDLKDAFIDPLNYYLVFFNPKNNKYYYLKIVNITTTYINVQYIDNFPSFKNYANIKVGVAKSNLRGNNSALNNSIFFNDGVTVISVGQTDNDYWNIEINYPYNYLPEYLQTGHYYIGDAFFIQDKMQISYNFKLTYEQKDYNPIKSMLNA